MVKELGHQLWGVALLHSEAQLVQFEQIVADRRRTAFVHAEQRLPQPVNGIHRLQDGRGIEAIAKRLSLLFSHRGQYLSLTTPWRPLAGSMN